MPGQRWDLDGIGRVHIAGSSLAGATTLYLYQRDDWPQVAAATAWELRLGGDLVDEPENAAPERTAANWRGSVGAS